MSRFHWVVALVLVAGAARGASFEDGLALKQQNQLVEAESIFAEVVREHPEDPAALREWATLLGWLGRFDDSIHAWERALATKPDEPDYLMALSRVQYWKGELAPARQRMEKLLAAAPDNADAFALAGDICAAQKDFGCARADYQRAQTLAPSAELERKLSQSAPPPRGRFDSGGQLDSYDTARGTEGSFFAQGSYQLADALVVSGGYEQLHQFGATDHRLNLGGFLHPIDRLVLGARVAISPTADTIAPWEASGGVELRIAGPVTALANVRHLDFSNQGVTIVGGGLRLDLGAWSLVGQGGVAFSTINPTQGFGTGRVEYAFSEAWHAYAGFARGVQAQLLLPPATATDVTAGVTWQIDRTWGLRLDYTYEKYGEDYVRNSLGSAVTVKF